MYKIVDVPEKMEKFYGKGTMLHPSIKEVEELLKEIPKGKITTLEVLGKKLAEDYGTDVTCPMRTGNAIKKISERYLKSTIDFQVPFWRVIRSNKLVIKSKNIELMASQIEDEGFRLTYNKSDIIKVNINEESLYRF